MFAVFGALGRLSGSAPIYAVATLYVSLVRGTPLIVQIIFVYLALPEFGIVLDPLPSGILALSFNYGAYLTEIFRAGIEAIPRGQREARRRTRDDRGAHDAADHPAAGRPDRDPGHRQ